jgi:DNA-binding XRE family transcriptional regulator
MESKEFLNIRHELEMTQKQLSRVLCVSTKAIQSFEQGWRNIPTYIQREMLLLLSLKQSSNINRNPTPCWEIKNCPDDWKNNCLVWKLQVQHFCWYINGTFCQGRVYRNWEEKIQLCRECEMFQAMLSTTK